MGAENGDSRADGWLAAERAFVLSVCRGICGPDLAEDACQDTLTRAWQALERGVRPHHPRAWLAQIARRAALDLARREQTIRRLAAMEREAHTIAPRTGRSAEEEVIARERVRALVSATEQLPPRQRQALAMRALEGASYSAIVARLGTEGTAAVRELIRRARIRLRRAALGIAHLPLPNALREVFARSLSAGGEAAQAGGSGAAVAKVAALAAAGSVVVGAPLLAHSDRPAQHQLRSGAQAAPAASEHAPAGAPPASTNTSADRAVPSRRSASAGITGHDGGSRQRPRAHVRRAGSGGTLLGTPRREPATSQDLADRSGRPSRPEHQGERRATEDGSETAHGADDVYTPTDAPSAETPDAADPAPNDDGTDGDTLPNGGEGHSNDHELGARFPAGPLGYT